MEEKKKELSLIEREIARLEEKSQTSQNGLSIDDLKKLDILVKNKQLASGQPTEIVKNINEDDVSNDDIYSILNNTPSSNVKKHIKGNNDDTEDDSIN